jgi:hypothetical protein
LIDGRRYLELQVTPENRRLQLQWTLEGRQSVMQGNAALEDFMVAEAGWVETATHVAMSYWVTHVEIPARTIFSNERKLSPESDLRTAVCRYDYSMGAEPVISSTAVLKAPDFHRYEEWARIGLVE